MTKKEKNGDRESGQEQIEGRFYDQLIDKISDRMDRIEQEHDGVTVLDSLKDYIESLVKTLAIAEWCLQSGKAYEAYQQLRAEL